MKNNERTPSEVIDHIADIIKEREQKNLPTFFTISIEQFEKTTPVAEKEKGYENFKQQVLKYMTDYQLTAIGVKLYSGQSRNSVKPFQEFKVQLVKTKPNVVFSTKGSTQESNIEQLESAVPLHRYYDEKFELQMRIMRIEMDKQTLSERVLQLTERYEDKIKEQELRFVEKLKLIETEKQELEDEIKDYEKEIAKNEKDKHNSFGNIALGSISSRAIENLAKSDLGTGVLKSLLGDAGYQTLQGHLAGIESDKQNSEPQKETARIITQTNPTDPRQVALNFIQAVAEKLPDMYLRMLYDIADMSQKNTQDLQVIWNVAQQIAEQRKKTPAQTNTSQADKENEGEEEE